MSQFTPFGQGLLPEYQVHLKLHLDQCGNGHYHEITHYMVPGHYQETGRYYVVPHPPLFATDKNDFKF